MVLFWPFTGITDIGIKVFTEFKGVAEINILDGGHVSKCYTSIEWLGCFMRPATGPYLAFTVSGLHFACIVFLY